MRILFSPIGATDPISTLGDAAMLHITRHFLPDKIFLFLSPEMKKYEELDSRYSKSVALLSKSITDYCPEVFPPEYSKFDNPHLFDHYIEEFGGIISRIAAKNNGAEILINVTSGTAAMQAALIALCAFSAEAQLLVPIQVETPAKGINEEGKNKLDDYDLEYFWEFNLDNEANRPNRCRTVASANFGELILRENVRALVGKFDYVAALHLARQCPSIPEEVNHLIEGSIYRLSLDQSQAAKAFGGNKELKYDPKEQISEYLWMLEVLCARELWPEFLRAMTPAITETFFRILARELPEEDWIKVDHQGVKCINSTKVLANQKQKGRLTKVFVDQKLNNALIKWEENQYTKIANWHLEHLINIYVPGQKVVRNVGKLRKLENKARHRLAHTICKSEKKYLEKMGGMKLEDAMTLLFKLNNVEPGLYSRINTRIIELL